MDNHKHNGATADYGINNIDGNINHNAAEETNSQYSRQISVGSVIALLWEGWHQCTVVGHQNNSSKYLLDYDGVGDNIEEVDFADYGFEEGVHFHIIWEGPEGGERGKKRVGGEYSSSSNETDDEEDLFDEEGEDLPKRGSCAVKLTYHFLSHL